MTSLVANGSDSTAICTIQTRTGIRQVFLVDGVSTPNRGFSGASICLSPCGSTGDTQHMARNITAIGGVLTPESEMAIKVSFNGHGDEIIQALRPKIRLGLPHAKR
jgi:hypothetical protein